MECFLTGPQQPLNKPGLCLNPHAGPAEAVEESQLGRIDGLEGPACNDQHDFQNRAYPAFASCTIT